MSNEKERCDCVISGRITQSEKAKMQEHDIKVRDAIQCKISLMEDPRKLLRYRRNILRNEIRAMKFEMEAKQRELDEINEELGQTEEIQSHYNLDVIDGGNNLLSRYEGKRGNSNYSIDDYIESKDGQRVLENLIVMYGGRDKEDFKNKLIDYVKLQCKQ